MLNDNFGRFLRENGFAKYADIWSEDDEPVTVEEIRDALESGKKRNLAALGIESDDVQSLFTLLGEFETFSVSDAKSKYDWLPQPLAIPLFRMIEGGDSRLRLHDACDTAEGLTKFSVFCMLSEFRRMGKVPEKAAREVKDKIMSPTFGKWLGMARELANDTLAKGSGSNLKDAARWVLDVLIPFVDDGTDKSFLKTRNILAHNGAAVSKGDADRLAETFCESLERVVAEAEWLRSRHMLAVKGGAPSVVTAQGTREGDVEGVTLPADDGVYLAGDGHEPVHLAPMCVFESPNGSDRIAMPFHRKGVGVEYAVLGVDGIPLWEDDAEGVEMWNAMIASLRSAGEDKGDPSDLGMGRSMRFEAEKTVGRDVEIEKIAGAVESGEKLVWVPGIPGVGKSSVMASVAARLKDTSGGPIMYWRFSSRDVKTMLALVHSALKAMRHVCGESGGVAPDKIGEALHEIGKLAASLSSEGKRAVLVVDGLDEASGYGDKDFFETLLKLSQPGLSLVVGSRNYEAVRTAMSKATLPLLPNEGGMLAELDASAIRSMLYDLLPEELRRKLFSLDAHGKDNPFVEAVVRASGGLPQYVVVLAGELKSRDSEIRITENPPNLPKGLAKFYEKIVNRAGAGEESMVKPMVLALLGISPEPLSAVEIADPLRF